MKVVPLTHFPVETASGTTCTRHKFCIVATFLHYHDFFLSFPGSDPIAAPSASASSSAGGEESGDEAARSLDEHILATTTAPASEGGVGGVGHGHPAASLSSHLGSSQTFHIREASPIKEALLTKFARLAPSSSANNAAVANSFAGVPHSGHADDRQHQQHHHQDGPQSLQVRPSAPEAPAAASSSSTPSAAHGPQSFSGDGVPPPGAAATPSWLHQVRGRIARTVEEKYTEYKSERERRMAQAAASASASANTSLADGSFDHHRQDATSPLTKAESADNLAAAAASSSSSASVASFSSLSSTATATSHSFSESLSLPYSATSCEDDTDHDEDDGDDDDGRKSTPRVAPFSLPPPHPLDADAEGGVGGGLDSPDSRTPVALGLDDRRREGGGSPKTTPSRERRKFTFSFLDKSRNSTPGIMQSVVFSKHIV